MPRPSAAVLTWRALPLHILVLATALAVDGERRPLRVAGLLRGLLVQMVYRTLCGEVLVVPGRAVLVWSVVHHGPISPGRRVRRAARCAGAALVAACIGALVALVSFTGVLALLNLALHAAQVPPAWIQRALVGVVAALLATTGWRALVAYRVERRRQAHVTRSGDGPIWRVDLLGSSDQGSGYGGLALDALVERADAGGAQVVLLTRPESRNFYRRHGFRLDEAADLSGMLLMRRRLPSAATERVA